jgi:hypothetical protein
MPIFFNTELLTGDDCVLKRWGEAGQQKSRYKAA